MARTPRNAVSDMVYHVLNRANGRMRIFQKGRDYQAFEQLLAEAKGKYPMRMLAYCLMPNHWHLLLYPRGDHDLSRFMRWLGLTHTQRWHAAHKTIGYGHLYQVNQPQPQEAVDVIRYAIKRSRPYGQEAWIHHTARKLNLEATLHPRGRPRGK